VDQFAEDGVAIAELARWPATQYWRSRRYSDAYLATMG
jgi:hypothetical protein